MNSFYINTRKICRLCISPYGKDLSSDLHMLHNNIADNRQNQRINDSDRHLSCQSCLGDRFKRTGNTGYRIVVCNNGGYAFYDIGYRQRCDKTGQLKIIYQHCIAYADSRTDKNSQQKRNRKRHAACLGHRRDNSAQGRRRRDRHIHTSGCHQHRQRNGKNSRITCCP